MKGLLCDFILSQLCDKLDFNLLAVCVHGEVLKANSESAKFEALTSTY